MTKFGKTWKDRLCEVEGMAFEAREAVMSIHERLGYQESAIRSMSNRIAALESAKPAEQKYLVWRWTFDEHRQRHNTGCGQWWHFNEGGIAENHIQFCPHCGGKVEAALEIDGKSCVSVKRSELGRLRSDADTLERLRKGEAVEIDGRQEVLWLDEDGEPVRRALRAERDALAAQVAELEKVAVVCKEATLLGRKITDNWRRIAGCGEMETFSDCLERLQREKVGLKRQVAELEVRAGQRDSSAAIARGFMKQVESLEAENADLAARCSHVDREAQHKLVDRDALAAQVAELDDQLNRGRAQLLQAGNEKAELERRLKEAKSAVDSWAPTQRVEWVPSHELTDLRRNDERWKEACRIYGDGWLGINQIDAAIAARKAAERPCSTCAKAEERPIHGTSPLVPPTDTVGSTSEPPKCPRCGRGFVESTQTDYACCAGHRWTKEDEA